MQVRPKIWPRDLWMSPWVKIVNIVSIANFWTSNISNALVSIIIDEWRGEPYRIIKISFLVKSPLKGIGEMPLNKRTLIIAASFL